MPGAEVLPEILRIAERASEILLSGFRRPDAPPAELKGEIDLVTEFDRRSEDLIRTELARSFPGFDVVAEEGGGTPSGTRPVVWVDPLDGTTNYAHGHPFFSVSIGIADGRDLSAGVVHAPALGWTFTAAAGAGTTKNGAPCRVSRVGDLGRALLATGFPYDRRTSDDANFTEFVALKRRAQGVRRCGCASIDLCLVAEGTYDGYWEKKLQPWDLAAGAICVAEAGGRLSDWDAGPADVRRGALVATNGLVHDALVSALSAVAR